MIHGIYFVSIFDYFRSFRIDNVEVVERIQKIVSVLGVAIGYMISFYLLSLTLMKLPLTFTYAVWSGVGTVLTTIVGVFLFKEHLNLKGIIGIF